MEIPTAICQINSSWVSQFEGSMVCVTVTRISGKSPEARLAKGRNAAARFLPRAAHPAQPY